jgi:hypothetical protein
MRLAIHVFGGIKNAEHVTHDKKSPPVWCRCTTPEGFGITARLLVTRHEDSSCNYFPSHPSLQYTAPLFTLIDGMTGISTITPVLC